MDKRIERSNRLGVLKIKTDITLYRCIAIVLSILSIICGVLYLTNNYNWLVVIISFLIGVHTNVKANNAAIIAALP